MNLQNLTNKASDTLTAGVYNNINFSAGGLVALAAGASVQVGASVAQAAIENNYPQGGIYVAHDWIGHLNFDMTGKAAFPTGISDQPVPDVRGHALADPALSAPACVAAVFSRRPAHLGRPVADRRGGG